MEKIPEENKKNEKNQNNIESFEQMDLETDLIKGIYSCGFLKPSKIQQKGMMPILQKKDVIIQSQSGTGKTAIFCIPSLKCVNIKINSPQVLILSNTRELAYQTYQVLKNLSKYMQVKIHCSTGGKSIQEDERLFQQGLHIISGTPGRIYDMILREFFYTANLKMLIIDEADEMLQNNFKNQVYDIYKCIPPCQIVLTSATLPNQILQMSKNFMQNPVKILLSNDQISVKDIQQYYIHIEQDKWKYETLLDLYDTLTMAQTVIFCNTKERVDWLAKKMRKEMFQVSCIHGDLPQKERDFVIEEFKQSKTKVLISTDIGGRGIDIQDIRFVINYDMPTDRDQYIHRIGRSGRFGRKAAAINFVINEELWKIEDLEKCYSIQINEMPANLDELIQLIFIG